MIKERLVFLFLLLVISVTLAIPRPDDSEESKEDDDDDDDICSLPAVKPGPATCRAIIPRWTFNKALGECQLIEYGGCRGTKNLFHTKDACNVKCNPRAFLHGGAGAKDLSPPSACTLPKAVGMCRAVIPSYYFDSAIGYCRSFDYSGCNGNANRFSTIEDCVKTCQKKAVAVPLPAPIKETKKTSANAIDVCNLPPIESTGRQCLAFIPSWTFNSKTGKCESYVYGGCGKTANLFFTEAECQAVCSTPSPKAAVPADPNRQACLLPVTSGPCFGFMKRYAFNKEKNRCELFTYGGCQGNGNNFLTADQCFQTCGGALPSLLAECENVSCPNANKRYLDRGCRPEYKGKACCPTSFTCPEDKAKVGVCHYGGVTYNLGERVAAVSQDHPCKTDCHCVSSSEHQDGATIRCTDTECPVMPVLSKKDCQVMNKPGQCCPSVVCHTNSSEEVDICIMDGKEYLKGQQIPTGDPCKVCLCTHGFNGLNGPGCRETHCLIDNRIGCVPVYTDNVCCPTSYKCAQHVPQNVSRIIRVDGQPGKQGVATLPGIIPGGDYKKWQVKKATCLLPKEIGPCRMSQPAFYYDSDQMMCLPFLYGGCKGNENRYATEQECVMTCQYDTTTEQKAAGQPDAAQKESSPFITSGVASTLPARVPVPRGVAVTLPGRLEPNPVVATVDSPSNEVDGQVKNERSSRCSLPKMVGPCRMSLEMFYFDSEHKDCRLFFYGGCKGNGNQFKTLEDCRQACVPASSTPAQELSVEKVTPQTAIQVIDVCQLPQEIGPCKSQVHAYFYNGNTGACETFWYGGCLGNGNRFETEIECQSKCVPNWTLPIATETTASPPAVVVENQEPMTTLATNQQSNLTAVIVDPCVLPADIGPCRASAPRFHYNAAAGECQLFNYGGCRGNLNNFETIEQCQVQCHPAGQVDIAPLPAIQVEEQIRLEMKEDDESRCKLPADPGFCQTFEERFFYDSADHQCKPFSWGGCLGNANNFATLEQCLSSCAARQPTEPATPVTPAVRGIELRARARMEVAAPVVEDIPKQDIVTNLIDLTCSFGNDTLNLGDRLVSEDPCEECVCSTPPEITCVRHTCPSPQQLESVVCREIIVPGQCCPDYACVSANPPSIDVCADVVCPAGEHCDYQSQESLDGSWMPPVGVCVADVPQ